MSRIAFPHECADICIVESRTLERANFGNDIAMQVNFENLLRDTPCNLVNRIEIFRVVEIGIVCECNCCLYYQMMLLSKLYSSFSEIKGNIRNYAHAASFISDKDGNIYIANRTCLFLSGLIFIRYKN